MIRDKKILITGVPGYIGSHLVQSLKGANEIFCVHENPMGEGQDESVNWIHWNMNDEVDWGKFPEEIDIIMHLAMNPARDPEKNIEAFRVNTMSTLLLLEYGKKAKARTFLYTSSGSVYGFGKEPFKEDDPVSINDFYSLTKYQSELLVRRYSEHFNTVILRYFVPYGPNQTGKLVPNLVSRVKKGEEITITNSGNPVMNPIYITDLIEATIKTLDLKGMNIFNIGGTEGMSILDISNAIGETLGKEPKLKYLKDPAKEDKDLIGDITRMKENLSFTPKVSFKYGIKNLV
jgi:UDP-glucose 4-epimerase